MEVRRNTSARTVAGVAIAGLALGAGIGLGAESHTNEVARGKIITAETCLETNPIETTITEELLACMEDGVPGGESANPETLEIGDPKEFVQSYIAAQKSEAEHLEVGRITSWALAPFAVAGVVIAWST